MTTTTYAFNRLTAPTSINATTTGDQFNADSVSLGNGDSFALYDLFSSSTLIARLIGPDGRPVSAETRIATGVSIFPLPHAAVLANGDVVVTWADNAALSAVHYRIYDQNLNPVTEVRDILGGAFPLTSPNVTALPGGGFAIVYADVLSIAQQAILYNTFDASGTPVLISNEVDLSANVNDSPSIAALTNGNIAIAYNRIAGNNSSMYRAVFDSAGGTVAASSLFDNVGTVNDEADVVALPSGGFTVNYRDNGWNGVVVDITTEAFSASGSPLGDTRDASFLTRDSFPKTAVSTDGYQLVESDTSAVSFINSTSSFTKVGSI